MITPGMILIILLYWKSSSLSFSFLLRWIAFLFGEENKNTIKNFMIRSFRRPITSKKKSTVYFTFIITYIYTENQKKCDQKSRFRTNI